MKMTRLIQGAGRRRRPMRVWGASVAAVAAIVLVGATPAGASLQIQAFDGATTKQDGSPQTQAGAHPYEQTLHFDFSTFTDTSGNLRPTGHVKNLDIEMPPGFVGDPSAAPTCTEDTLLMVGGSKCPDGSQVGVVELVVSQGGTFPVEYDVALYNQGSRPGVASEFGFVPGFFPLHPRASIRTGGDYGVTISLRDIPQPVAVLGTTIKLWGVPADPGHDVDRGALCMDGVFGHFCFFPGGNSTRAPLRPFISNPTDCSAGPLITKVRADSWQEPGEFATAEFSTPAVTGCDKLAFNPSLELRPDDTTAGAPSGYVVNVHVPQSDNPTGLATPPLKKAVVTLPAGTSVSPSSADGLGACTPAQIGLDNADSPTCPPSSTIGEATLETPLLPKPMTGSIYLATPHDNPSHSLMAMYLVLEGYGVLVKLPGEIALDPDTGQLTATFDNSPQLPFTDLRLRFGGGPRASLSNPATCGTKTTTARLDSWGGQSVTTSSTFTVDKGCDKGFTPDFAAGTTNPLAGRDSPFTMTLSRDDADQMLGGISVDMPAGLLGRIASVPLCADAEAAAGTCTEASRIGSATTASGPGPSPFSLPGRVYLTGPYKGAPFGLSIVVPALAGPFDLGTVVVRAAIFVDTRTTALRIASDPLPTILQGIPLQIRRVNVNIDRPGFMVNPTSCAVKRIDASISSTGGDISHGSSRFQVGGCGALGFTPKLSMRLTGKGQTRDGKHPGLKATLTQAAGQANLSKVKVALPLSLALDAENAQALCKPAEADAGKCPAASIVGSATVQTPILKGPLKGPVYFVEGIRTDPKTGRQIKTLPKLWLALRGEIAIDVWASSSVDHDALVTTFAGIPDAPVSRFDLTIAGGSHGILAATQNLCSRSQIADVASDAQNGKVRDFPVTMKHSSCSSGKKRR